MHLRSLALVSACTVAAVAGCDSSLYLGRDNSSSFAGADGMTGAAQEGAGAVPNTAGTPTAGTVDIPARPSSEVDELEVPDLDDDAVEEEEEEDGDAEADDDAGL